MYFPYLRGKQFELLALRELLEGSYISNKVIPVIEPIKLSATLVKTLESFVSNKKEISIIHNPKVGNFSNDIDKLKDNPTKDKFIDLLEAEFIIKAHIFNKNSDMELRELLSKGVTKQELLLINENRDFMDKFIYEFSDNNPRYILMPGESTFRRRIKKNIILLDDKFGKQKRNTDYTNVEDEFFSDDHLYCGDDGFIGFSDYSIVGREFSESGFAPFAVAIHIVYFDTESKTLRIRHFVSDSNEDINDPAKKFYEALTKLAEWQEEMKLDTCGMKKFMDHYKEGTYPGLGIVKKLSIMHHIELVSKYLDGV